MISDHIEILGPSFFKSMTLEIKAKKQTLNENSCFHLTKKPVSYSISYSILKQESEDTPHSARSDIETETEIERKNLKRKNQRKDLYG